MIQRAATPTEKAEQERRLAAQSERAFIERAGMLTELLTKYGQGYSKEKNLAPAELVFAAALYVINLRETYPDGKPAFDEIAAKAAEYYDKNA